MEATTRAKALDLVSEDYAGVSTQSCGLGYLMHGCTLDDADCSRARGKAQT